MSNPHLIQLRLLLLGFSRLHLRPEQLLAPQHVPHGQHLHRHRQQQQQRPAHLARGLPNLVVSVAARRPSLRHSSFMAHRWPVVSCLGWWHCSSVWRTASHSSAAAHSYPPRRCCRQRIASATAAARCRPAEQRSRWAATHSTWCRRVSCAKSPCWSYTSNIRRPTTRMRT